MSNLPPRMQYKLYHDLILPDETLEIRKTIRAFAEKEIFPIAHELGHKEEKAENFPFAIFQKMADEGFFKVPFSKDEGGLGLNYPACASAVIAEEVAYISNSMAALINGHCFLAGKTLGYGSSYIKRKYLIPLMEGKIVGSFAMTEPQSGSDVRTETLTTRGVKKNGKYIVNGQKRFITNACVADFVATLTNVEGKSCMLLIDLKSDGCYVGAPDKKLGNRGELTSEIYFENVEVPEENLIGDEGNGLRIALGALMYGRTATAAGGVGMAQSAFDECVEYMKKREAFGRKLSQFQYWQFLLAERAIQIENARNLYSKAALRLDHGVKFPDVETSGAKYYGSKISVEMARDAVQIFGGLGLMVELGHDKSTYKVEEIYRDTKIGEILEGTNEIQKMIIARAIFERE